MARVLALLFAATAVALVVLRLEPRVATAERNLDDAEQLVRSDEIAFADIPLLRSERDTLRGQVGALMAGQPEATFVRDLARIARQRNVRILSTAFERERVRPVESARRPRSHLDEQDGSLVLEGSYANLLQAIADLSRGDVLIAVGTPTIRRGAAALVAQIPVTLSEPPRMPPP